jgi:DNA-binding GntR family transcriptional regulator
MNTWRTYITTDLKARIDSGHDLPTDWTLNHLAADYQVSLTPIRSAAGDLIDQGYLKKLDNGRLSVEPIKVGAVGDSAVRPRPPKDFYDSILGDLIELCLSGSTEFLREEETATKYGISPSAVRQIFHRLAGEGILAHLPRRGWQTRPFCRKQLEDYTRVRVMLELEALRLAWPKLDDDRLQILRSGNQLPKKKSEHPSIDDSVHPYLVELADNEYISNFFERNGRRFRVFFTWEALDRQAAIETVHQHWAVLDALLARNRTAARHALQEHLNYSHHLLINHSGKQFSLPGKE